MRRLWGRLLAVALLLPSAALGARLRPPGGRLRRGVGAALLLRAAPTLAGERAERQLRFEELDANGDGVIDRMEIMYFARDKMLDMGESDKSVRESGYEATSALYGASDLDGDGVLGEAELEFAELISTVYRDEDFGTTWAAETHGILDTNKDGLVDQAEFERLASTSVLGEQVAPVSREAFAKADVNGDGALSRRECCFAALLLIDLEGERVAIALQDLFDVIDTNLDARLSRQEIANAWVESRQRDWLAMVALQAAMEQFGSADADDDGYLDERETNDLLDLVLEAIL